MFVADYALMDYGTGALMAVPGARRARLRLRREVRPRDPPGRRAGRRGRSPFPRTSPSSRTPRTSAWSTPASSRACRPRRAKAKIIAWLEEQGPRRARRSPTACATGCSRASATGAARSPSSTARRDGIVPVPEDQLPVAAARRRRLPPEGQEPARDGRGLAQHRVPALRRPGAPRDRHDGHLRRLVLVLPALPRPPQRRAGVAAATSPTTGCPSTSTSAASSTRSCTSCTRASSPRRSPTWATSTRRSRSPTSSRRG